MSVLTGDAPVPDPCGLQGIRMVWGARSKGKGTGHSEVERLEMKEWEHRQEAS